MTKRIAKTIEMTKAQHEAWDKHLCSGEIEQGDGCLIDEDGKMCCLGVLEYALEGKVTDGDVELPSDEFLARNNIKFYDEMGRSDNTPYLTGGTADVLNDTIQLSFKQIAQRIKSRVKFIDPKK